MTFHLNIISLKGKIFSGEVESITLPAETGRMTVLEDHMPIVSPLVLGQVSAKGEKNMNYVIRKGIFTMSNNNAELLVEDLVNVDEIDQESARLSLKNAKELMNSELKENEKNEVKYQLERSKLELKLAGKNNKTTQNS